MQRAVIAALALVLMMDGAGVASARMTAMVRTIAMTASAPHHASAGRWRYCTYALPTVATKPSTPLA